jgi:ELWxxDGT repeat protein
MRSKILGASLVVAAALVVSGHTGGVQASTTVRPAAVVNVFGTLDLLLDIYSGSNSSNATFGPILNGKMLFSANTPTAGTELWVTDGTAAGTTLVKDINPGATGSFPRYMTVLGDKVYFQAFDATSGTELWVTDGTANGTTLVKDINPGASSSSPTGFTALGSRLYFSATGNGSDTELWVTDGTANGTTLVKDINPGPDSSSVQLMTPFDGKIFFNALSGTLGQELWSTDGTANGTVLVKDIDPTMCGSYGCSGYPVGFQVFGNRLFFRASNSVSGAELWSTDGTTNGTVLVKDIKTGAYGSDPTGLTVVGDKLLFSADDGTSGSELWSSDGTSGGTSLLKDINTGSNSGSPLYFSKIGDLVYFFASDATTGHEPWKSDGTANGTARIADIRTGINGSLPSCFMCYGGEGPRFRRYGDSVVIFADDGVNGAEPWITGGSITGATILADIRPGSSGSVSSGFMMSDAAFQSAVVGGKFLFGADNGQVGSEIWTFSSPPGAPTAVTATPSTNSATVSWTAPTSTSTVSSYTVTSNPGAFTCTTATLSCSVTGLLSNQDYTFTVTATSALGTGAASLPSPQLGSLLNSLTPVTDIVSDTTLGAGSSVTVLYTGFNANELVLMLMASNPVVIGSANADANGNVAITGIIPLSTTAGSHTLALYAPVSGFGAKQPISVTASAAGGSTTGSGTSAGSGAGSGGGTPSVDPATLPATGRGDGPALLALLLLVVGIGLIAGRRTVAPLLGNHPRRSR